MRIILSEDSLTTMHPFAITVFEDSVFWADWSSQSINLANKFNGTDARRLLGGLRSPTGVQVVHALRQPAATNVCGVCSHICLPRPHRETGQNSATFECSCPDTRRGFRMAEDKRTCIGRNYSH